MANKCKYCTSIFNPDIQENDTCFSCSLIEGTMKALRAVFTLSDRYSQKSTEYWTNQFNHLIK